MADQNPNQLTPTVSGVVRLQSPILNEQSRAKVLKTSDHEKEVGAKVINRHAPILVQKVDIGEQGILPGPLEQSGLTGLSPVSNKQKTNVQFSARPTPHESFEPPRSTLIPAEQPAPVQAIQEVAKLAEAIAQIPITRTAPTAAPYRRIKVQFAGKQFGKTTVFCQEAVVSDSLIVLAYNQNGESAIVEPPVADIEAELMVRITGQDNITNQYHVMSNEWSFEAMGLLWVVLIRIKPEDS